ncbi:MAG: GDSL-type esterase/lipase family protein [Candidatus Bathyarchaeota archaeon]
MEKLVFVALGDSLTVGSRFSGYSVPYTYLLERKVVKLTSKVGKPIEVKIHNRGINGDLTGSMLSRFQMDVADLNPNYVIILGGSNDFGWGVPVEAIYDNLKKMYTRALDKNIEPIACSVPSILGFDELIPPRMKLNKMIEQYCAKNNLAFVDLFTTTADKDTSRLLEQYSDDGLHLTEEGYRKIAEEIFRVIEEKISRQLKETA